MAYRSDVRIKLIKSDFERLSDLMEKEFGSDNLLSVANHLRNIDLYPNGKEDREEDEHDRLSKGVRFGWDSRRWYEGDNPEIDYIMKYIRGLENYGYCRMGEETGDIEDETAINEEIYEEYEFSIPTLTIFEEDY